MAQEWHSTALEIDATEDLIEVCYQNGWTDGTSRRSTDS